MKKKLFAVLWVVCLTFGIVLYHSEKTKAEIRLEYPVLHEWDDFKYSLNEDSETVTVREYTGYEPEVIIPAEIDGKPVVSIDYKRGFEGKLVTSITLPESVEKIEGRHSLMTSYFDNAVFYPSYLTNIHVLKDNPVFSSENGILYNKDKTELLICPSGRQGEVKNLPDSLKKVAEDAFYDCEFLTRIELPDEITHIEDKAFSGCFGLLNIKLPKNLKYMGQRVFFNCTRLSSLEMPKGLEYIRKDTFGGCVSLKEVSLPEKLKRIDDGVFSSHEGFENIHYPKDSAAWKKISVGKRNDALKYVHMGYEVSENGTVEITDGYSFREDDCIVVPEKIDGKQVTGIGDGAMKELSDFKRVSLPEGLIKIGDAAFYGCESLEEINFPKSLHSVGKEVFYNCRNLKSIKFPGSVKFVDEGTFTNCMGLESIHLPKYLIKIGRSAFHNCVNLADVYYPADRDTWNWIFIFQDNSVFDTAQIHFLGREGGKK